MRSNLCSSYLFCSPDLFLKGDYVCCVVLRLVIIKFIGKWDDTMICRAHHARVLGLAGKGRCRFVRGIKSIDDFDEAFFIISLLFQIVVWFRLAAIPAVVLLVGVVFWCHGSSATPTADFSLILPPTLHRILKLFVRLEGPTWLHRHQATPSLLILNIWGNSTTHRWDLTKTGVRLASVKCLRPWIVELLTLRSCALTASVVAETLAALASCSLYSQV